MSNKFEDKLNNSLNELHSQSRITTEEIDKVSKLIRDIEDALNSKGVKFEFIYRKIGDKYDSAYLKWKKSKKSKRYRIYLGKEMSTSNFEKPLIGTDIDTRLKCYSYLTDFIDEFTAYLKELRKDNG